MADDLMALYSKRILALASDIPHEGRLSEAQGQAMRRSPQCGSSVTAFVNLDGGRISDFAQEVRACALGQASAAVLGGAVIGLSRGELEAALGQLDAMLDGGAEPPAAPFAELEVLGAARDYPNRHASIRLAWQAAIDAIGAAETQ
ncbi:MAG: iron-sulfur cluster assembly scaffold protein [Paracoccus sp. (in: a-proteobacteria)]|nr:iron-sulfur cluster assembly scaffold protein [Paracoccus sp. (in: a-proteobacteria)]